MKLISKKVYYIIHFTLCVECQFRANVLNSIHITSYVKSY